MGRNNFEHARQADGQAREQQETKKQLLVFINQYRRTYDELYATRADLQKDEETDWITGRECERILRSLANEQECSLEELQLVTATLLKDNEVYRQTMLSRTGAETPAAQDLYIATEHLLNFVDDSIVRQAEPFESHLVGAERVKRGIALLPRPVPRPEDVSKFEPLQFDQIQLAISMNAGIVASEMVRQYNTRDFSSDVPIDQWIRVLYELRQMRNVITGKLGLRVDLRYSGSITAIIQECELRRNEFPDVKGKQLIADVAREELQYGIKLLVSMLEECKDYPAGRPASWGDLLGRLGQLSFEQEDGKGRASQDFSKVNRVLGIIKELAQLNHDVIT